MNMNAFLEKFSLIFVCLLSLFLFCSPVYASDSCQLGVMLIEGKKSLAKNNRVSNHGLNGFSARATKNLSATNRSIPLDVRHQLATLPFADYELLQKRQEASAVGKKTHFSLRDADGGIHQLDVTPVTLVSQKVQALVCWKGPSNTTLLKTKLWIKNGQSMVVGAEMEDDDSLILNLSVKCPLL